FLRRLGRRDHRGEGKSSSGDPNAHVRLLRYDGGRLPAPPGTSNRSYWSYVTQKTHGTYDAPRSASPTLTAALGLGVPTISGAPRGVPSGTPGAALSRGNQKIAISRSPAASSTTTCPKRSTSTRSRPAARFRKRPESYRVSGLSSPGLP